MRTEVLTIDPAAVAPPDRSRIVRIVRRGGLIVFPTDTFYGLGGDGLSRKVIRKVYDLKQRDRSKPLLVLVSDKAMALGLAEDAPEVFHRAADAFWPGPLTVVLRASALVPPELGGGTGTIALRLPDIPWLRDVVREVGSPLIATSANISGGRAISSAREAADAFLGKVRLLIDGGPTHGGAPSTVLDLSVTPPRLVREGAIPRARLSVIGSLA